MQPITPRSITTRTLCTLSAGTVALGLFAASAAVNAESFDGYKVYSPSVTKGETEIEAREFYLSDDDNAVDETHSGRFAIAHAFTSYWATELYGVYESEPGEDTEYEAEWENRFQLTPTGKYWLDLGALVEIERGELSESDQPYSVQYGLLFEKQIQDWVATLNLSLENEVGSNASDDTNFLYRGRVRYRLNEYFQPDVEFYSAPGPVSDLRTSSEQQTQVGPGFSGETSLGSGSSLSYSTALLFGANSSSPDVTPVVRLEYEFF
ncbi:hypothetical protein [Salinisphaera orenii]|uniref:hypothetical protein n=1 Tax=Salinisphaera orenii TaxID=856731 RepID=UPI000DBE6C45